MNTITPFPALQFPNLRDPLACLRSFLGKCRDLARKRGDFGAIIEHNVLDRFVTKEATLREAGATTAAMIDAQVAAIETYWSSAAADGRITPREKRAIDRKLSDLHTGARHLKSGLTVGK